MFENEVLFYGIFIGMGCHFSYLIAKSAYVQYFYKDQEVQTDAWDDYSDRPSQTIADNITSSNTPIFSPVENIDTGSQILTGNTNTVTNTVTTILPVPPVNIEILPNPDITMRVTDTIVVGYDYIDKAQQLADMMGLWAM